MTGWTVGDFYNFSARQTKTARMARNLNFKSRESAVIPSDINLDRTGGSPIKILIDCSA